MVLMGTGGGGNYRQTPRRGGALGDRIKCLCRGDWIHGISHLPVQGRRASLAPVRLTLVGELWFACSVLNWGYRDWGRGGGGGARSDEGEIRGHCQIQRACSPLPARSLAMLRDSMERSGPAPSDLARDAPTLLGVCPAGRGRLAVGTQWSYSHDVSLPSVRLAPAVDGHQHGQQQHGSATA